ncbi:MAG TPA: hypothetical protein VFR51_10075 [Pyrinomonadaceae bacterium]|nr:hypothetical protein [Pyrinomonadaceae bacterium]
MPTTKSSKKKSTKKFRKTSGATATASGEVVMWLRLPRAMSVAELQKLGFRGGDDICFSGDTCVAATAMRPDVGIVVQADLQAALDKAGLSRRADPCFGGDTCIV